MIRRACSLVVQLMVLIAVAACGSESSWSGTSLTDLAQGWTGHGRLPLCRTTGPDGEDLGMPGTRYCEWQLETGVRSDRLNGMVRDSGTVIHWVRTSPDSADQVRVADSLGAVFSAAGLQRRECAVRTSLSGVNYGVVWSTDTMAAYIGRTTKGAMGGRLQISLADSPASLPSALCP